MNFLDASASLEPTLSLICQNSKIPPNINDFFENYFILEVGATMWPKQAMQNGQNSVAGSEATTGGMSGIIGIVLKIVTGNGD